MVEPPTDRELLAQYGDGNEDAAREIVARYQHRLLGLLRSRMSGRLAEIEESGDLVQSILCGVLLRGRERTIDLSDESSLWPLLVSATLNKIRDRAKYWGRQRRDAARRQPLEVGHDVAEHEPTPEDLAVLEETIRRLLDQFNERRRRIIELILEGYGTGEIAAKVGASERTVYTTRMAAAEVLGQLMAEE